jgi:amino acid adenylation domain-containing protein
MTPPVATVVDAVLAQAGRSPDDVAVADDTGEMSFRELDRESLVISRALAARGIGQGQRVAAIMEGGCAFAATCLAVWRCGAAIVPIDRRWPESRVRAGLNRTGPALVIAGAAGDWIQRDGVLCNCAVDAADLSTLAAATPASASIVEHRPAGKDAAYVVFTSGSTGYPKAIEGRHDGLLHFLRWETTEFNVGKSARIAQLAPVSFDVSYRDYWVAIMNGGRTVVPAPAVKQNPRLLLRWIRAQGINHFHIVPSILRLLLDEVEASADLGSALRAVDLVICAGETLFGRDVVRLRRALPPGAVICNLYGPSETTLAKIFNRVGDELLEEDAAVPLGRPIDGATVEVTAGDECAAAGEIGEIVIRTEYASNGYVDDPEATRSVFRRVGIGGEGRPLVTYRTGDCGRFLPDGRLAFEGRLDGQVKIMGNRVEPGEVEIAMMRHPAIRAAAVVPREEPGHATSLIGFYVTAGKLHAHAVKSFLADQLPAYMIPSVVRRLDRLPLNINGKVDRQALAAMADGDVAVALEPRRATADAPIGVLLRDLLSEVLGVQPIDSSSFIELGGASLDAMRFVAAIERQLRRRVFVADVLDAPTLCDLQRVVEEAPVTGVEQPARPSISASEGPLSIYQEPLHRIAEFPPARLAYSERIAFSIEGELDAAACCDTFAELVTRHQILRSRFIREDDCVRQRVVEPARAGARLAIVDLVAADPDHWRRRLEAEWAIPFDLATDPPVRATLYRVAGRESVLTVIFNHVILDIVGLLALMKEAAVCYRARKDGIAPAQRAIPWQYLDYCSEERRRLSAPHALAVCAAYWAGQFRAPAPKLAVGAAKRPIFKTYVGNTVSATLRDVSRQTASRMATGLGITEFSLMLAAFIALLHVETAERDIVVGTPFLVRDRAETQDQVGCFLNMLPIRAHVLPGMTADALSRAVHERVVAAQAHKAYPFDWIARDNAGGFSLDRSPLFDITFTFLDRRTSHLGAWSAAGLVVRSLDVPAPTAKYDLTFHVRDLGDVCRVDAEYNKDVITRARAETLAREYLSLLERWKPYVRLEELFRRHAEVG